MISKKLDKIIELVKIINYSWMKYEKKPYITLLFLILTKSHLMNIFKMLTLFGLDGCKIGFAHLFRL